MITRVQLVGGYNLPINSSYRIRKLTICVDWWRGRHQGGCGVDWLRGDSEGVRGGRHPGGVYRRGESDQRGANCRRRLRGRSGRVGDIRNGRSRRGGGGALESGGPSVRGDAIIGEGIMSETESCWQGADECIQEEISRHEELSGLSRDGSCGLNSKRMVIERPKKRPNAKTTRKKCITNKRKVRDQPDTNHGVGKSKSLFQKHKTNKRKERDHSVEKMTRKKTKKLDGVDVYIHPAALKRRSKGRRKSCRK
eukprot:1180386-Prorocentrum_minimum.AAC.1